MTEGLPHICFIALNAFPLLSGSRQVQIVGGAQLQQVIIARQLAARGYPVSMICLDYGQDDRVTIDGIEVYRAFRPRAGIPIARFLWPRISSVWRCMKVSDAAIYYQRSAAMWTGVMARFCKTHHKKSIFAAAGNPDLERHTRRIEYARDRYIYEYGVRNVDRILVQNEEQEILCLKNFGRAAAQVPNIYMPAKARSANVEGQILWISTIRAIKQPEYFLQLAVSLPQFQFRMVGGASPREPDLFEAIAKRAKDISNLQIVGYVPYSEVDHQFEGAALLVNTSASEGFPNTFLQAWANGVPTVSFVDCGARLNGRRVGVTVSSIEEMTNVISKLKHESEFREEQALQGVAYVHRHHSLGHVMKLYEKIFASLASSDKA